MPEIKSITAMMRVWKSSLLMSYWLLNLLLSCYEWNFSGLTAASVSVSISVSIIL